MVHKLCNITVVTNKMASDIWLYDILKISTLDFIFELLEVRKLRLQYFNIHMICNLSDAFKSQSLRLSVISKSQRCD